MKNELENKINQGEREPYEPAELWSPEIIASSEKSKVELVEGSDGRSGINYDEDFKQSIVDYTGPRTSAELEQRIQEIKDKYGDTSVVDVANRLAEIARETDSFEKYRQEAELRSQEKEWLVEGWQKVFLGKEVEPPPDLNDADNSRLREWLHETLMKRAGEVLEKLIHEPLDRQAGEGGAVNNELKEELEAIDDILKEFGRRIAQESDPKQKAKLQFAYLSKAKELFNKLKGNFVTSFDDLPVESNRPNYIEKNQEFLCGGATLLGFALMERDGVSKEYYRGMPPGHSVDIVRLADGQWCYGDYANGIVEIIKPTGEKDESGLPLERARRLPVLQFDNPAITYQTIPLLPKEDFPSVYLNTGTGFTEDLGLSTGVDWPAKFVEFNERLGFSDSGHARETPIMLAEKERLKSGVNEKVIQFLTTNEALSSDQAKKDIDAEIIKQKETIIGKDDEIKKYLFGSSSHKSVKELGLSGLLADALDTILDGIKNDASLTGDQDKRRAVADGIADIIISKTR